MPAARPRALDDSRSEASSTITNLKERSVLGPSGSAAISKGKRIASSTYNGSSSLSKPALNGTPGIPPESDPNLPRTNWQTLPTPFLHTYAHAHHLPSTSTYTHPHADIIYKSSHTALRAPSAVLGRRKLRDLKSQRLKAASQTSTKKEKATQKERERERERSSDRLKQLLQPTDFLKTDSLPSTSTTSVGKQTHNTLALAVRRHFNSQQVSEPDTIAKFLYVVHHGAGPNPDPVVAAANAAIQDHGYGTGSQGRQASKGLGVWGADGGSDLGFRLRFRPDVR